MNEKGGPVIMILALFIVVWLLSSSEKIEPIQMPVDGSVQQMEGIKQSLIAEPIDHIDHISDSTKMIDPQPSPSDKHEKARREIIIFTRPNCPPCDQWKRFEQPRFEADGWVVAYCSEHNFGLTPHFLIEKNGKTYDHKGYLSFGKIDEVTR